MGLRDFELTSDYVLDPTEKTELIERLKKQNKLDERRNIAFFSSPKTADGMRYILFYIIVFNHISYGLPKFNTPVFIFTKLEL